MNKENIPGFYLENIFPNSLIESFQNNGFKKINDGYLDIPPWPDIAMKKEDLFKKMGLGFLIKEKINSTNVSGSRNCIVDYFNGTNPGLEKNILKYDVFEKSPFPVKQLWGHHRWFIFEPL